MKTRSYNQALDNLEALIVARLFELTKMNMSGTGTFISWPSNYMLTAL
jgi:hypothetical protein